MATDEPTGGDSNAHAPESAVAIGTRIIETYEVQQLINVGGMGEVYRGVNIHTGDPVAIKIVLPSLAHDPKISALFQKEAQVLGRLNHDSIVRYHIYTLDKGIGRPCLVMEFVEGESLTHHLEQDGPMPEETVRRLIRRLAEGLGQAHTAGTVHRDLTPNNVILPGGSVDRAKIIDFGIAKTTTAGSGTVLQGQFAGTLNFVSPEQLGDFGGKIDARSDIYSLGLLAAACCRGETIDMGTSVVEAVNARRGVPDISDIYPELRPVLSRMLEPNPANRPASMAEVIDLLDNPPAPLSEPPQRPQTMPAPDRTIIAPMPSIPPAPGQGQNDPWTTPPAPTPGYTNPPAGPGYSNPPPPTPGYSNPPPPTPGYTNPPAQGVPGSMPPQSGLGQPGLGQPGMSVPPQYGQSQPPQYAPPPAGAQQSVPPMATPARPKKGSKLPIVLVVLLLVLGGGGWFAYQSGMIPGFSPVPPNSPPVAVADQAQTEAGKPVTIDVLANDTDKEGGPLTIDSVSAPKNGTAAIQGGKVIYTPNKGFSGQDSFGYVVADDKQATASGVVTVDVKAPPPPTPAEIVAAHVSYLKTHDTGDCTFLDPTQVTPEKVTANGYALDKGAFAAIIQSFKTDQNATLSVNTSLVNPGQCPAVDAVRKIRAASEGTPPVLTLDRQVLISGERVNGTLKGFKGKSMLVLIVDGDGGVHNVTSLVDQLGDDLGAMPLTISLKPGSPSAPEMLMMVLTDRPLATAQAADGGAPAKTVMPLIEQEIAVSHLKASVAMSVFQLQSK